MDFESDAVDLESLDESRRLGRRIFLMGALAAGAAASLPLNYAAIARAGASRSPRTAASAMGVPPVFPAPAESPSGPTSTTSSAARRSS